MKRAQVIAIGLSIAAIIFLFRLPKFIINQTNKDKLGENKATEAPVMAPSAGRQLTEADLATVGRLRKKIYGGGDMKKRYIFADSLAIYFFSLEKFDSAAKYADELVLLNPDIASHIKAGHIYYQLYSSVTEPTVANRFATKAQAYYAKVLEAQPGNTEVKNNLAMTYVTSDNPMQAISLLREVLATDPDNETAILNLGLLSIQSGQYEKAIERFKKLTGINPSNWKAHLYLGVAYKESGQPDLAVEELSLVVEKAKDAALVAEAKELMGQH